MYDYTLDAFVTYSYTRARARAHAITRLACASFERNRRTTAVDAYVTCIIETITFYYYTLPPTLSHVPTNECRGTFTRARKKEKEGEKEKERNR